MFRWVRENLQEQVVGKNTGLLSIQCQYVDVMEMLWKCSEDLMEILWAFWLNGFLLSLKASVFTIATLLVHKYLATLSIC